jgi:hypothetical protein
MIITMTNKCDLKDLSLQLYGKEVEITLAENSASQKKFNTTTLKGILHARLWGDKMTDEKRINTVIALLLRQGDRVMEIPCKDIEFLK